MAKQVKPSERGELEITSINQVYLERGDLDIKLLGRGFAWLDTGTNESLLAASQFVETIESRQGYKVACLEEIAFNNKWISRNELQIIGEKMSKSNYGNYILSLLVDEVEWIKD